MKRLSPENIIIWASVLFVALVMLWMMVGCTSQQKVYEATYSDGCYFNIKKMSSEQAADMQQKWDFKGCEVREQDEDSE